MRWVALLLLLLAVPVQAAEDDAQQPMPGPLVRVRGAALAREITGNTLSGRHASGMPYSEFHSPDGRIYGHNNNVPVRDGCWVVREDDVCYTYEKGPAPGVFCWQFFRAEGGYTILLPNTGTVGTAKLEPGNPYKHDDGGKPWSCDALLSRRPTTETPHVLPQPARLDR